MGAGPITHWTVLSDVTMECNNHDQWKLTQLQICQQNVNKSLVTQGDLLHQLNPKAFDIVAIQEPYLYHNHNMCVNLHWYTLYPKEHYVEPEKTRSIIFINKWITTDSWIQVDFGLSDVTAV